MIYYVWSGSLRGDAVDAEDPSDAVKVAVSAQTSQKGHCLLGSAVRVTVVSKGEHITDVYFSCPYEEEFPTLFDGSIDVQIIPVEKE